ncbi:MAG: Rieske (2Fe-2S) protein [Nocardioidaceae bacterium]
MPDQPTVPDRTEDATSRRTVLRGVVAAGAIGVATPLIAACGGGNSSSSDSGGTTAAGSDPGGSSAGGVGSKLVATSDVPVGSGTILTGPKIVVTQPTAGDYKAFTAVCTHLGCTVGSISDGFIICPCHQSHYAIATGVPTPDSPAKAPLAPIDIKVKGSEIDLA